MNSSKVSVVIPAYNQADFLGEAIRSVLGQTYVNLELIVVNDASPDHTDAVVREFADPRLTYIVHPENRRLSAARNTGILASSGELVALLDADDYFHADKLALHVRKLREHPDIGATYNSRFELNYSAATIREIVRPPANVGLADFLLGFPFTPSDTVMRRSWALQLFDERVGTAEDTDFPCRLALAGCRFARVDRALNYRRHHAGRPKKDLSRRLNDVLTSISTVLADPRCPAEVQGLRNVAFANNYRDLAYYALIQNETAIGHEYLKEAVRLTPALADGEPSELTRLLVGASVSDESKGHDIVLSHLFANLPQELSHLSRQLNWAIAYGYLTRATRALMWSRPESAGDYFGCAGEVARVVDDRFIRRLAYQLLAYEIEFGARRTERLLGDLSSHLERIGGRGCSGRLVGFFSASRAFQDYQAGAYASATRDVFRAVFREPGWLRNRGMASVLFRSLLRLLTTRTARV